ncbi:NAD(H) kinase 1-like isoform X1 [Hibiscus syriacus]|uniref:NAD(H) kinase 1-like isoform X1 n=2 Tax=Hibiscus syriacus TaxID=106335 RepID=A0A6A2WSI1_HIBSY|nr:NAD(H) kinase 1-like isoform X1 [Hibiscus syriacus]
MKAAKFDQSRLLQQTICYHKPTNWSFTVAWGYSVHVYETVMPRSFLRKPLETFQPFKKSARPPLYMFNTRLPWVDPSCQAAHAFFLESVERSGGGFVKNMYRRKSPRNLAPCSASGNHSAEHIEYVRVTLQATRRKQEAKIECCDVEYVNGSNVADIKLRTCISGEVIA